MDIELDELQAPFLGENTQEASNSDELDFEKLATIPVSESYTVHFNGQDVHVDSADWRNSFLLKTQVAVSFITFTLFGLAEQTVGTIIPKLQDHYHVNDLSTGLVFLASTSGYFTMALVTEICNRNLGVRGVGIMGAASMTIAFLTINMRPPFSIFIFCYFLSGLGFGSLDASFNGWMGGLVDSNQLMGILHGCYGIGCLLSPPIITKLIERHTNPWRWSDYYLVLACLAALCLILIAYAFRHETPAKFKFQVILKAARRRLEEKADDTDVESERTLVESESGDVSLSDAMRSKPVWFFAVIMFVYLGGEVAFGAWMVTFCTRIKKLSYSVSSYMATSFWTGLTAGRICLGFVTAHYFSSEITANWAYIALALVSNVLFCIFAFTSLTWLLFVIVFVAGLFVGPIFPTTIVAAISVLPVKFHATGIGFICAFGGGGGAAIPFLIGLVAETSTLGLRFYPFMVAAIYALLFIAWLVMKVHYGKHKRLTVL